LAQRLPWKQWLARRTIVAELQRKFHSFRQASYFGAGVKFGLDQRLTGVEENVVKSVLT
jgi:hypothetical protein